MLKQLPGKQHVSLMAGLLMLAVTLPAAQPPAQIQITGADLFAAQLPKVPALIPVHRVPGGAPMNPAVNPQDIPVVPPPGFYPADVSNPFGGSTLDNFVTHNIFVNPLNPAPGIYAQSPTGPTLSDSDKFLTSLYGSSFIHLMDQYTGDPASVRTVGQGGVITFNTYRTTYYDQELAILVHAAARTFGGGKGQLLNLFFRQGTDICSTFGGSLTNIACYSPDNFSTFVFCAFHDTIDFADLGTVVYSIEPYENTPGCRVPQGSPNGRAIDSMANVLSHEVFEAISDPLLDSWFNNFSGGEIVDLCAGRVANTNLNGSVYQIQAEYSNQYHACAFTSFSAPPN